MALVRLKTHRNGELVIRGVGETVYSLNANVPCEVPARIAALYLGDEAIEVNFTENDKKDIANLPENRVKAIRRHLGIKGDILEVLYPKKAKTPIKKKVEEVVEDVVETVTETILPKEEKVEEKVVEKKPAAKKTTAKKTPAKKTPAKKTTTKKDVE